MKLQHAWPDKIINGVVVAVKRGPQRVTRPERVVHDWLFKNTGRYPVIHYFDAAGKFFVFRSYKVFERRVGKAVDQWEPTSRRSLALKRAWKLPGVRRRHGAAWDRGARKKLGATIKKIFKAQGLKVKDDE